MAHSPEMHAPALFVTVIYGLPSWVGSSWSPFLKRRCHTLGPMTTNLQTHALRAPSIRRLAIRSRHSRIRPNLSLRWQQVLLKSGRDLQPVLFFKLRPRLQNRPWSTLSCQ